MPTLIERIALPIKELLAQLLEKGFFLVLSTMERGEAAVEGFDCVWGSFLKAKILIVHKDPFCKRGFFL
jgi:hypothetical protein